MRAQQTPPRTPAPACAARCLQRVPREELDALATQIGRARLSRGDVEDVARKLKLPDPSARLSLPDRLLECSGAARRATTAPGALLALYAVLREAHHDERIAYLFHLADPNATPRGTVSYERLCTLLDAARVAVPHALVRQWVSPIGITYDTFVHFIRVEGAHVLAWFVAEAALWTTAVRAIARTPDGPELRRMASAHSDVMSDAGVPPLPPRLPVADDVAVGMSGIAFSGIDDDFGGSEDGENSDDGPSSLRSRASLRSDYEPGILPRAVLRAPVAPVDVVRCSECA
eukprot:IDg14403t1